MWWLSHRDNVPAEYTLKDGDSGENTGATAGMLPCELPAVVETPGPVAEPSTKTNNSEEVDGSESAGGAIAQAGELLGQPVVGLVGLGLGLLLREVGLSAGLGLDSFGLLLGFLFLLLLNAGGLSLGLDLLLLEVGRDGMDGRGIDVDQGGGGSRLCTINLDLGRERGSSLRTKDMLDSFDYGARTNQVEARFWARSKDRSIENLPPQESAWGPWQQSQRKTLSRVVVSEVPRKCRVALGSGRYAAQSRREKGRRLLLTGCGKEVFVW